MLLGIQFDPVTCIKEWDYKKAVKPSNIETSRELVNLLLHEPIKNDSRVQKVLHICDSILSIFILIYSVVESAVRLGPLGYTIACLIILSIGSIVALCKLGYSIYNKASRVEPQGTTATQNQRTTSTSTFKKLVLNFRLGHEVFIYAIIICGLYRLINEKSWQFQDASAGISFIMFVWSIVMDGWQTKLNLSS